MQNISLCDNKISINSKNCTTVTTYVQVSAVCSDKSMQALRPYAIFTPFSRMEHQLTMCERW